MKKTVLIGAMLLGFILIANIVFGDFYVIPTRPKIAGTEITSLPYTISSSGFYYITRDLTSTGAGIVVEADNVTIDLMGFSLIGPGKGSSSAFQGVKLNDDANVEVRNGTVRDFGGSGIQESYTSGKNHRIIGVRANGNGYGGINLLGVNHLIKNCTVANNDTYGIYAYCGCTVTGNTIFYNQDKGIYAYQYCTVTGNTLYGNRDDGIRAYQGCTVTGNTVGYSQNYGIYLGDNCLFHGNTAVNNNRSGGGYTDITCFGGNCTLVDNHVTTPTS